MFSLRIVIVTVLFAVTLILADDNQSRITIKNGLTSGLTIRIEKDVPKHLCSRTLNQLEELLTETSRSFHNLTKGLNMFGDITVVLPDTWSDSDCANRRRIRSGDSLNQIPARASTDIYVSGTGHPTLGILPRASQYGQCGVQGRYIELSYLSLTNNKTLSQATLDNMIKEYVKFKFGVFEESGLRGDPLYPETYIEAGTVYANRGCNGSQVICPDDDNYDSDVTTKQNMLCQGKSIQKIIQTSLDQQLPSENMSNENKTENSTTTKNFLNNKSSGLVFRPPNFKFVLPKQKLFVLVLDRSGSAGNSREENSASSNWEVLQQAMNGFITKLPADTQLSIITYSNKGAYMDLPPTIITEENRQGLHGRIPRRVINSDENELNNQNEKLYEQRACISCALKMAFKTLKLSKTTKGVEGRIVLVTSDAKLHNIDEKNAQEVQNQIDNQGLPIYAIALTSTNGAEENSPSPLTKYGNRFVLSANHDGTGKRNRPSYLSHLSQILTEIVRQAANIQMVSFHRDHRVPDLDNQIIGNFVVEEHLRKDLWITLTVEDERDIAFFEILSPSGHRHSFPQYDRSLAYFRMEGLNEPGIWSYSIRLYETQASQYPVHIEVSGEPNVEDFVSLNVWTTKMVKDDRTEVYLYASVQQGKLPVLDANVVATIKRPGINLENVRVQLRDLGTGYPDITKGDGIYSAYFIDFAPESGFYQISVTANSNSGNARTPRLTATTDPDNSPVCCGSEMPGDTTYTVPTGPFSRYVVGNSFFVEQTSSFYLRQSSSNDNSKRLVNDVFPPSRVTDFTVDNYLQDSLFVTLRWTAPGGDFDQGKASRYEIRCYTNKEALRDENFSEMSIPVHASLIPQPETYGSEQRCTVGVPWPNEVFYYAIVAFDESGNRGLISNTIAVYIKEEPSTVGYIDESFDSEYEMEMSQPLLSSKSNQMVYIILGIACCVAVIILVVAIFAIKRHYRIVKGDKPHHNDSEKANSDDDDDLSISATLKKLPEPSLKNITLEKTGGYWNVGLPSPTSDYSSQKSTIPSISETMQSIKRQQATSQELPGVHKVMLADHQSSVTKLEDRIVMRNTSTNIECESRTATHSTDCSSIYESSDNNSSKDQEPESPSLQCNLPPRISFREDLSVYRDLSNIGQNDYFSFTNIVPLSPGNDLDSNVITVPPFFDQHLVNGEPKKRHESLV